MANFTTISIQPNIESQATPNWGLSDAGAANYEIRWSGTGTGLLQTGSASWPADVRPGSTGLVAYSYLFTADVTGTGFLGGNTGTGVGASGSNPTTQTAANSITNYLQCRWSWDSVGTFASAPIFTAYDNTSDNSSTSGLLAGSAGDTSSASYLKANAYGQSNATVPVPAADPSNAPVVTDGTAGALTFTSAAWLTHFQSLQGSTQYIQYGTTPTAATAQVWYFILALFNGPNETPGTYTPQLVLQYSWQ